MLLCAVLQIPDGLFADIRAMLFKVIDAAGKPHDAVLVERLQLCDAAMLPEMLKDHAALIHTLRPLLMIRTGAL